jgi:hypothetical protein
VNGPLFSAATRVIMFVRMFHSSAWSVRSDVLFVCLFSSATPRGSAQPFTLNFGIFIFTDTDIFTLYIGDLIFCTRGDHNAASGRHCWWLAQVACENDIHEVYVDMTLTDVVLKIFCRKET